MKPKIKKIRLSRLLLILCIFYISLLASCGESGYLPGNNLGNSLRNASGFSNLIHEYPDISDISSFHRDAKSIDFGKMAFNPWDVSEAAKHVVKRSKKPYTIMVYMNGSSLESEAGAATDDIIEMLESNVNAVNLNLLLFTGGTNRWQNDMIPENTCAIWEVANGYINEIASVGLVNMGDPGTLSSFIDFGISYFPAEKYGLIMWDHGGGSIAGYGDDEKFNNDNLTLLDLNYAFERSGLAGNKLEFLGFDSCLMGSVEMAMVAADYAKYMIASEDLEPGGGWDYGFLFVLNKNPGIDGAMLGKEIVDSFMSFYGNNSDDILALSVTDLSKVNLIMGAMGDLMSSCSQSLDTGKEASFQTFAAKRNQTKTFGEGSPRDNECDMVDIGDMAYSLSDLFTKEAAGVLAALENAVIYNRHNSNVDLKGLSTYYIYGGKQIGHRTLNTYDSLGMNPLYSTYLNNFYKLLTGKIIGPNTRYSNSTLSTTDSASYPLNSSIPGLSVSGKSVSSRSTSSKSVSGRSTSSKSVSGRSTSSKSVSGRSTSSKSVSGRSTSNISSSSRSATVSSNIIETNLTLWQPSPVNSKQLIMTGMRNISNNFTIPDMDVMKAVSNSRKAVNVERNAKINAGGNAKANVKASTGENAINTKIKTLWPTIEGKNVCLYPIYHTKDNEYYAIPASLNGKDCDIIVMFGESCPDGKILGVRHEDGIVIQKGYDPIKKGDKLSFYFQQRDYDQDLNKSEAKWYQSDVCTVENTLKIEWSSFEHDVHYYSLHTIDIRNNEHYGKLVQSVR